MAGTLALVAALAAGCASSIARDQPAFEFALFGDMPYSQAHANLMEDTIDEINRAPVAFAVHLGDITAGDGPCTDRWFAARAKQFARIAHPFVLVFGDNEWTDCHRSGFDPMERLAKMRTLFHARDPQLPNFARQSPAYPEHTRWTTGNALFVTLNVPGSNNNLGRTPAMDAEHAERMQSVLAWIDEAVTLASAPQIETLVLMMHANPDFEEKHARFNTSGYAPLRKALRMEAKRLGKPLYVAHGDTHFFKHDRPLAGAPNLVRIEVDGWPSLGWARVGVPVRSGDPLAVERLLRR